MLKLLPLGAYAKVAIVNSMYLMHTLLIVLGDYFLFKLARSLCGRECAVITLMSHLLNEDVIRFTSRTSMNGVEGSFSIAALFFYHQLPKKIPMLSWDL